MVRPLTPPLALTYLKYASAPRVTAVEEEDGRALGLHHVAALLDDERQQLVEVEDAVAAGVGDDAARFAAPDQVADLLAEIQATAVVKPLMVSIAAGVTLALVRRLRILVLNAFGCAWSELAVTDKMPLGSFRVEFHDGGNHAFFGFEEPRRPHTVFSDVRAHARGRPRAPSRAPA